MTVSWPQRRAPAGIRRMLAVAAEDDVPADILLAGTGLSADLSAEVTGDQELGVARNLLRVLGDPPGLGLRVGANYRLPEFGIWGFALLTSPTLRDAAVVGLRHLGLTGSFARIRMVEGPSEVAMVIDDSDVPADVRPFLLERELVAIYGIIDALIGEPLPALRLELAMPRPPHGDMYELAAGCPVRFDAPETVIIADAVHLDRPLPHADPHTWEVCERECRELLVRRAEGTLAVAVRDRLLAGVGTVPGMSAVAAELHITPRTLHRRLAAEGTSYRRLLDEVRHGLAVELLGTTGLSVEQVAARLGYTEASSLIHAFRRWTGTTPRAQKPFSGTEVPGPRSTGRSTTPSRRGAASNA
ncbi:AraC family transcriptional regulator [Longispora sp. K20-0274]|uniref:AraC family transcriptional regulator n=1 Tax=Longispora sp. K20-0274 TaxID=3088255 RepID=UPI00399B30F8